jgi:hypothetical protein
VVVGVLLGGYRSLGMHVRGNDHPFMYKYRNWIPSCFGSWTMAEKPCKVQNGIS